MKINDKDLRKKIIDSLKSQGFHINPHLRPKDNEKETLKMVHKQKRREQLKLHKKFLVNNLEKMKKYLISGKELDPENISIKLIEVKSNSCFSKLFLWWNLIWWSIPYNRPIGRQMRFILWDEYHNSPLGLFCLQSPILRTAVRDKFLNLKKENIDYWINQSLHGQRIGALPPYNELLGAKMVAMSITSNEVREAYARKYQNTKTLLKKRNLPNRLLFITTTSAYGKSSIYERLKYKNEIVSQFIGYTSGSGTFHLPEDIYIECLQYLEQKGIDTKRGYGTGPSRKMRLIAKAFRFLKIPNFTYHNIKRGYYLFSNVKNLLGVIHNSEEPLWYNRPFSKLTDFWLKRWCIPRSNRIERWRSFDGEEFFQNVEKEIETL
ncbi:MAG: Druantia anti-phage system protein DruA [Candidatus Helarchaeota archaeon]